jgi:hypothetical protein
MKSAIVASKKKRWNCQPLFSACLKTILSDAASHFSSREKIVHCSWENRDLKGGQGEIRFKPNYQ